jgi:hypothetical protein
MFLLEDRALALEANNVALVVAFLLTVEGVELNLSCLAYYRISWKLFQSNIKKINHRNE